MRRSGEWARRGMLGMVLALAVGGCGGGNVNVGEAEVPIAISKIPGPIMQKARKEMPDVSFESALNSPQGGKKGYKLTGKKAGKPVTIHILGDGSVVPPQ